MDFDVARFQKLTWLPGIRLGFANSAIPRSATWDTFAARRLGYRNPEGTPKTVYFLFGDKPIAKLVRTVCYLRGSWRTACHCGIERMFGELPKRLRVYRVGIQRGQHLVDHLMANVGAVREDNCPNLFARNEESECHHVGVLASVIYNFHSIELDNVPPQSKTRRDLTMQGGFRRFAQNRLLFRRGEIPRNR